jgi:hypothetical protein
LSEFVESSSRGRGVSFVEGEFTIHELIQFGIPSGFIKGAESIPVLISIPLTGFLNDASLSSGKAGYYICSALTAISAVLMFFIGHSKNNTKYSTNR